TTLHALNSLHDGVCVLGREMQIVWLNNVMEKRHGKLAKLKGSKCFDAFQGKKDICENCPSKRTLDSGKTGKSLIKWKGILTEITTSPINDPKGKTVAVIEIVRVVK
ncbi:MAG: PAS domain-containing protein, partial [Candidatus Diapherotrites archaeon]|nr:PAS domain-containing protein [Candidatus Diapherotrites archaeon]